MARTKYRVKVRFVYDGYFDIVADNREEAREDAEKNCGMVGGHIHSTLDNRDVEWEFGMHPEKKIGRIITI